MQNCCIASEQADFCRYIWHRGFNQCPLGDTGLSTPKLHRTGKPIRALHSSFQPLQIHRCDAFFGPQAASWPNQGLWQQLECLTTSSFPVQKIFAIPSFSWGMRTLGAASSPPHLIALHFVCPHPLLSHSPGDCCVYILLIKEILIHL